MSDCNKHGEERKLSEIKTVNCRRLSIPDAYAEYDRRLHNRLVETTNSLFYDSSCSAFSTPDHKVDVDPKNLSLSSLCNYSFEHSASASEDINLSCEDCNIMEEVLPYPTHLSLYEVKQKSLSNSITELRNTHRYDEFMTLNTDEQTDVDSYGRCSEPELVEDAFNKCAGDAKHVYYEEVDNLLDPTSATLSLLSRNRSNEPRDNCIANSSKICSASDVGTPCCSVVDYGRSCEITSGEASNTYSKCSGSFNQNSKTLSRYEIMKQRKIAKSQRKHCNISSEPIPCKINKGMSSPKSIEQLVSFIEGKDSLVKSNHINASEGYRNNHTTSSAGCKRHNAKKKKKKGISLNSSETISNSFVLEPTSLEALEHCVVPSCIDTKPSHMEDSMTSSHSLQMEKFEVSRDTCESISNNRTSVSWHDVLPQNEIKLSANERVSSPCGQCNQQNSGKYGGIGFKTVHKMPEDLMRSNFSDAFTSWPEASRCDVVDGFPEMMSIRHIDSPLASNFNQCNHNAISKTDRKFKTTVHNLNPIGQDNKFAEEDDKLTEFSYSTNTNSSGDEFSSRESELEEFVMVQKKKRVKERMSRPFHGKMLHKKSGKPEILSKQETNVGTDPKGKRLFNRVNYVLKSSDCTASDLLSNEHSQLPVYPKNCFIGNSLTSSNATSPDDDALCKKSLANKFKYQLHLDKGNHLQDGAQHSTLLKLNSPISNTLGINKKKVISPSCRDDVGRGKTVFFDTRSLNKLEKPKCNESADISFIFEEHSKNITGSPKMLPEVNRFNIELEQISGAQGNTYFGCSNSNADHLPVDISTSCSSEDGLNILEKEKSSQCTSSDVLGCDLQPNILMIPKQTYTDDLMLSLPYLPFATAPSFTSYPLGFASTPECILDHGQPLSQDSEQLLNTSTFQLQPTLPVMSPMYAPFNCYVAVIPSVDHDATFLANHSDINFCELTCLPDENETTQEFASFPYNHKFTEDAESQSYMSDDVKGAPSSMDSFSKNDDSVQGNANHVSIVQKNKSCTNFKNGDVSHKENENQIFTSSKESKNVALEILKSSECGDSFESDKDPIHFHQENHKRIFTGNNFNAEIKKSHSIHQSNHSDSLEITDKGKNLKDDHRVLEQNSFNRAKELVNDLKSKTVICNEKVSFPKSSFNLESAQIYLLNLFRASCLEENCNFYCEK